MTPEEEKELMARVAFSEMRLDGIMSLLNQQAEVSRGSMALDEIKDARFWALFQIVQELAERSGVDRDDFAAHFKLRLRLIHDQSLARMTLINPEVAAILDQREIPEVPTYDACPSIFDPPTE